MRSVAAELEIRSPFAIFYMSLQPTCGKECAMTHGGAVLSLLSMWFYVPFRVFLSLGSLDICR